MLGILYVVATPIGNLHDLSLRAQDILKQVDLIAAEDTRHSKTLLDHYTISTPMISLHEHNEKQRLANLLDRLLAGEQIALISDAGTPLISDPGYRLVDQARVQSIRVIPIPGPSALICALSAAGLATDRFIFEGFLPAKSGLRKRRLEELASESRTLIFYESTHRIVQCLQAMLEIMSAQRIIVVAKELTKRYEAIIRVPLGEILAWFDEDEARLKGEFVLLLEGNTQVEKCGDEREAERLLTELLAELSVKQAVKIASKLCELPKNEIYTMALELNKQE